MPAALERHVRAGLRVAGRPALDEFARDLRASLNLLMADRLAPKATSPVDLRVEVYRLTPSGALALLGRDGRRHRTRIPLDEHRPARPRDRVTLHTGDRVRVRVTADRPGHVVAFNVGPTGRLNVLLPPTFADGPLSAEVELTPPAGRERLVAVWTRDALPLEGHGPHDATHARGPRFPRKVLTGMPGEAWRAAVLELDHRGR